MIALDWNIFQATKCNFQTATPVDTSKFPKEFELAGLIPNIEDLDIENVKFVLVELSKLSNIVKKKHYIMKSVKKGNNI